MLVVATFASNADVLSHDLYTNLTSHISSSTQAGKSPAQPDTQSNPLTSPHYRSPSRESPSPKGKHIPRPPNAFILFRSDIIRQYKEAQKTSPQGTEEKKQQTFSKVAGEAWRNLSDEGRQVYVDMAEAKKVAHQERFPEYRFAPKRTPKTASAKEDVNAEEDAQESVHRICSMLNIVERSTGQPPRAKDRRSVRGVGSDNKKTRERPQHSAPYQPRGEPPLPLCFPTTEAAYPYNAPEYGLAPLAHAYGYVPFPYGPQYYHPNAQHYPPSHAQPSPSQGWASVHPGGPYFSSRVHAQAQVQIPYDINAYNRGYHRSTTVSPVEQDFGSGMAQMGDNSRSECQPETSSNYVRPPYTPIIITANSSIRIIPGVSLISALCLPVTTNNSPYLPEHLGRVSIFQHPP